MDSSDQSAKAKSPSASSSAGTSPGAIPFPPVRTNSQSSIHKSGHVSHRQSFAENLRNPPPSPRAQRHPSFTQQAIQELLLNHPPTNRHPNPRFAGRDWRDVSLGELASQDDVKWANMDTSVEEATMVLLKNGSSNVVLIRETPADRTAVSTFDHNDVNAYLLVVVGLAKPSEEHVTLYNEISRKAQSQVAIPLRDIQPLCRKGDLVTMPANENLDKVIEGFGSGIHLILVTSQDGEVVGILSQLRLLEFFWNEAVNFPTIDRLYGTPLRDLQIGSHRIIAINADAPLTDALSLMNTEGLTSVAVVDNGFNVVGNISTADVKHLTNAASLPLLKSTCMHFISVILSERGVEQGRDSFPVFYVSPYSTLAHTVAKLVATHSHRMWVVESASPSPSTPATPLLTPSLPTMGGGATTTMPGSTVIIPPTTSTGSAPQSPIPGQGFVSVPAAALPGAHLSGRLTGVVSLTDILNLFAKSSGLHPADPGEQRARRRQSSSSSVRPSLDSNRASSDARR